MKNDNRRDFLKKASLGGLVLLNGGKNKSEEIILENPKLDSRKYSANDTIRMAFIGCGIQGLANAKTAAKVEGVEIAAACDLYSGRLTRMKELFGDGLVVGKDYQAIIDRSDIDAICISTSDHWHDHILKYALAAGKPVYCEKPMMHRIEEGHGMITAEKNSGLPVQVGSQRASSLETLKAKELFEQGVIGQLILAEVKYDRNSANGAWQYSIPTDASKETVDWTRFIGDSPKMDFDEKRFFRWRNYADYGTGVAGDLLVHLFTALHIITSSAGPERIYGTGGLRFWKDGRDAPDVNLALVDYPDTATLPAFNMQMRVNMVDGSGGGSSVRLIGTEGVLEVGGSSLTLQNTPIITKPSYGGWDSFDTFSTAQQKEFEVWYDKTYGNQKFKMNNPRELKYTNPRGFSGHVAHWQVFINAVRDGSPVVEDTTFGMRAAGPALAVNLSMQQGAAINWDPAGIKIV